MVRRNTARPGDSVFVSGTLGDAALGLAPAPQRAPRPMPGALRPQRPSTCAAATCGREPRLGLGAALRGHASAAMDISDGLAKDLARMCSGQRLRGTGAVRRATPLAGRRAKPWRPTQG